MVRVDGLRVSSSAAKRCALGIRLLCVIAVVAITVLWHPSSAIAQTPPFVTELETPALTPADEPSVAPVPTEVSTSAPVATDEPPSPPAATSEPTFSSAVVATSTGIPESDPDISIDPSDIVEVRPGDVLPVVISLSDPQPEQSISLVIVNSDIPFGLTEGDVTCSITGGTSCTVTISYEEGCTCSPDDGGTVVTLEMVVTPGTPYEATVTLLYQIPVDAQDERYYSVLAYFDEGGLGAGLAIVIENAPTPTAVPITPTATAATVPTATATTVPAATATNTPAATATNVPTATATTVPTATAPNVQTTTATTATNEPTATATVTNIPASPTPSPPPFATATIVTASDVVISLRTDDGEPVPAGATVCLDEVCQSATAMSEAARAFLAASFPQVTFRDVTSGAHVLRVTDVAPYDEVQQRVTTVAGQDLQLTVVLYRQIVPTTPGQSPPVSPESRGSPTQPASTATQTPTGIPEVSSLPKTGDGGEAPTAIVPMLLLISLTFLIGGMAIIGRRVRYISKRR